MGKFRLVIVGLLCFVVVGCGLRGGRNTLADVEAEYDRAQDAIAHAEQLNAQQHSPQLLELAKDRLAKIRDKQLSAPSHDVIREYKYIQMLAQRAVLNALNTRLGTIRRDLQDRPEPVQVDTASIQRKLSALENQLGENETQLSNNSSSLDALTRQNERQSARLDKLERRTQLIGQLRSRIRQLQSGLTRAPPTRMGDTLSRLLDRVRRHDRVLRRLCDSVRSLSQKLAVHRNRIDKKIRGRHSGLVYPAEEAGLVGYWPFEDGRDGKFTDRAGNLDVGQTIGTMDRTRGIFGSRGISFSERGSMLGISDHPDLDPGTKQGFAISGWFSSRKMTGSAYLLNKFDADRNVGWHLSLSSGGLTFRLQSSGQSLRVRSRGDYLDNTWHHVAVVYDQSGPEGVLKLYVDGKKTAEVEGRVNVETDQYLSIGGSARDPDRFFTGRLDEIRIYARPLSRRKVLGLAARPEVPVDEACGTERETRETQVEPPEAPSREPEAVEAFDTGLIAHWPLDQAGDKWTPDRMGVAPGRVFGARAKAPGRVNQAMSFRGDNDRIRVMDRPLFDQLNALTVTAWVRPQKVARQYIFTKGIPEDGKMASPYGLFLTETEDIVFSVNTTDGFNQIRKVGYDPNKWIFLAGTYDGSTISLYVNGRKVSDLKVTGSLTSNDLPVFLGSRYGAFGGIQGRLDDVRLYNYALTEGEINQLPGL